MNTAWTISAGVTWFPNMASATTSSTDSSAASPAPAKGRKALMPRSPWPHLSEGHNTTEADWEQIFTTHRTVLSTCVFSSWST